MGFRVEDVIDEMFDMVKPKNSQFITFNELKNSGQADIIITMLIDAKGFYDYDQRENSILEDEQEFTANEI